MALYHWRRIDTFGIRQYVRTKIILWQRKKVKSQTVAIQICHKISALKISAPNKINNFEVILIDYSVSASIGNQLCLLLDISWVAYKASVFER